MGKFIDLTGQRFGRLTVIKDCKRRNSKCGKEWECMCDCGNTTIVSSSHLKSGHTKSCGCLQKDRSSISHPNFKGNIYEVIDKKSLKGTDSHGMEFYIDKEDLEFASKYCWLSTMSRKAKNGYYFCARESRKGSHRIMMLHNFIWELHNGEIPKGYMIDHIDMIPANCRISNLRLADKSLNGYNVYRSQYGSTGIVGVSKTKENAKYHPNKWRAYINYRGQRIELGYFDEEDQAVKARLSAEIRFYNEICPTNINIAKNYGIEVNNG